MTEKTEAFLEGERGSESPTMSTEMWDAMVRSEESGQDNSPESGKEGKRCCGWGCLPCRRLQGNMD
ncbi:hypothetical protein FACS1894205_6340 [Alphaproteobacteria bacterium]|nr:hypothetical protein FACS1894205_6340 [Alphaproteobacteria bacterium]